MKNLTIKACAVLSVLLGASSVWAAVDQERDEFNRSFSLPAKARVDVSGFSGNVDIQAVDGDMATVQIERTARNRAELDCMKLVLEQVASNLIIQTKNMGGDGCNNIQVTSRVLLSLPRHADLSIHGVSGPINVGEIQGTLRISGNSGHINLAQSGRGSRITGNSGRTNIKLRKLDARGLEVSGNSGEIKLYVDEESNFDVRVSGHSGSASSELPNVKFTKTGAADYYARIGSGGPTITVHGNSGLIMLGRYRE